MSHSPRLASILLFIGIFSTGPAVSLLEAAPRDVQIRSFDFSTSVLELFNFGAENQPLDGWRFCTHNEDSTREYTSTPALNGTTIEAGTSLFIYLNNDSPGGPDDLNRSQLGPFASVSREAYAIGLYFAPVSFGNGQTIADHLQWSLGGVDNTSADERTDEARSGGLWPDEEAWIAVTESTQRIVLTDDTGGIEHGPANYEVSEPPAERFVQIRSVDLTTGVIELHNFSDASLPLGGWQFCSHDESRSRVYSSPSGLNGVDLPAGGSLAIHLNNDAPGGADSINAVDVGQFAQLDAGPYGVGIYFPPVNFNGTDSIADYLQWSVDGVDDERADERADESEMAGVWTDQDAWIATTAETTRVELASDTPAIRHGPGDYVVTNAPPPPPPPPRRSVQIREVDFVLATVELHNFSDTDIALDGWSLCTHDDAESRLYTDGTALNGVLLEAGTSLYVHYGDDAPGDDPDRFNASDLGDIASGLDTGPYSIDLYFPSEEGFIDFELPELIADHLQWSIDGVDDESADERADESVLAGLWSDEADWIATTATTTRIRLTDETGGLLHSPQDYELTDGGAAALFHRGDTNDDGLVDLTDAVRIFNFLFLGGEAPPCRETADANNDGEVVLTDGVAILNFLFQGASPPADPGPSSEPCGPDPDAPGSAGDLGCDSYNNC